MSNVPSTHTAGGRPPRTARPDPRVFVRNATDRARTLSVAFTRDARRRTRSLTLPPTTGRSISVPDGDGQVAVEIHADGAVAAVTFDPAARQEPLFGLRDDALLVACQPTVHSERPASPDASDND